MANAMGIHAVRIEDPVLMNDAMKAALGLSGPVVIEVMTDPMELVMPPAIKLEYAKGFSAWMMKAVMDGRGKELIHLAETAVSR
jgi:pyruvate dehydrogenase (quinone)